jgi:Autophagy-related protein 27
MTHPNCPKTPSDAGLNNTVVCQWNNGTGRSCGVLRTQQIWTGTNTVEDDGVTFIYEDGNVCSANDAVRRTLIFVNCDKSVKDVAAKVTSVPKETKPGSCSFEIVMSSRFACKDAGSKDGDKKHKHDHNSGLSGGSIFLITLTCVLFAYLFAGIAWNAYKHGARGTDIVPNKDFWVQVPSLIVEGGRYIVNTARGQSSSPSTYESIE